MKCTLERLSKKVKFALIDRRNATREQVPIGHFTMFKSLINGLMHTSYIYRVHSCNQVQCQYFEELPKSQVAILGVMSYNVTKLTTQVMLLVYYCGGHHSNPLGRVWLTC